MIKIAPSILAADYANLADEVRRVGSWGADYVHFDVMDGSFVPTITFGPGLCAAVRKHTRLPLDVHIMVEHPETYITQFRDAGADILTFHAEADRHAYRTIQQIHASGMKAGIALNPGTPLCIVEPVLGEVDLVLIMSVNPGAGGQTFLPGAPERIRALKQLAKEYNLTFEIEVDGGINEGTAQHCVAAGADVLVSGSSLFAAKDPADMVRRMKELKL